ncbi:MAG: toxin-antitoxin system HicB family antitoxin [Thermodesulfobacteriota bacterium]|nr:toxin-antitoxin system HicB family antitoxin [Thermodesulfobacteriota bacterium]
MSKYSINVAWSEEDKCYIATVNEFAGLSAFGDTRTEAMEEAEIAIEGFLKVYEEDGCEPPEPETVKNFSGQTRIRLPKRLHASLSHEANIEGVSLNSYIVYVLSERHQSAKIEERLKELENKLNQLSINSYPSFSSDDKPESGYLRLIKTSIDFSKKRVKR